LNLPIPREAVYGLVLLAAVAHAAWNAMVKTSGDRLLMLAAIRAVGLLAGVIAAFLVPAPAAASLPFLAGAALVHYVYYGFLLNAYRVGDFSQVYPLARGVAPLVVALSTALFVADPKGPMPGPGVLLIALGVVSLSRFGPARDTRAVAFAVGTGLAIAGYTMLSGLGVRLADSVVGYVAWLEIATGAGVLAVAGVWRHSDIGRFAKMHWRAGAIAGVLSVGAYFIVVWAMSLTSMAAVAALRETSVVFAALLGTFLLREPLGTRRLLAATSVLLGILLLTLV
jgi:drug/metabolite transporter (DMT)-like permease